MFDGQLEIFRSKRNISQVEFMTKCRAAREDDPKAKHYIDILLSSVEYETFVKLMRIMRPVAEHRIAKNNKAEAKKLTSLTSSGGIRNINNRGGDDEDDGTESAKSPTGGAKRSGHKNDGDDEEDDGFGSPGSDRDRYSAPAKDIPAEVNVDLDETESPGQRQRGGRRNDDDIGDDADAKGDRSSG